MTVRILNGDCREVLRTLPSESVHCVVTSPPYFGLRDYGTAKWEGGNPDCDHGPRIMGNANKGHVREVLDSDKMVCYHCGARRIDSQIGLEQTPQEYVEQLVAVFREVRRVLRKDGTVWLNLGDSYANTGNAGQDFSASKVGYGGKGRGHLGGQPKKIIADGLKPKDLIGIPWRVAFALQSDGWWLRQDIIWAKPNPMPESVTDRCTKAHEYIFLLSKSERYFYDAEAVAEDAIREPMPMQASAQAAMLKSLGPMSRGNGINHQFADPTRLWAENGKRNKRSVWTVATQPFSGSHFATFPPDLIEPCIKAGCPKDGTVLDPFGGAGTTGLVADRLGRNAILIELNAEYAVMANRRISLDAGMFSSVVTVPHRNRTETGPNGDAKPTKSSTYRRRGPRGFGHRP